MGSMLMQCAILPACSLRPSSQPVRLQWEELHTGRLRGQASEICTAGAGLRSVYMQIFGHGWAAGAQLQVVRQNRPS